MLPTETGLESGASVSPMSAPDGVAVGVGVTVAVAVGVAVAVAVALAGGTATVTISKAGGISSAAMNTLVNGLAYGNTSEDPGSASRVVTLTSLRDTGANGGPNNDDNIHTALGVQSTVTVTPVNDEPTRTRLSAIVTRAAVETEASMENQRFLDRRGARTVLIARGSALADYAEMRKLRKRVAELERQREANVQETPPPPTTSGPTMPMPGMPSKPLEG